ncbi:PD-(D/E)XK nuclease domain-containing protein [Herbivorax sp. ANBcel31]|uniref:PD-(D/E)XK nuclease domain-containing protein n=1 Tax=Herbivorax sp. ANBcel31 TaxID=3069754 RepID=UPI0027B81031|nr:PD-(D/E)XK nuclease domain-containing protein [Herbivorax sp. ANBcel31]MDQ2087743.1 PD-(D/E)XK nuclease domain-containing protein [Herbivorax sp. ANBcel31]
MYAWNANVDFNVYSNREFGLGRPDIVLIPKSKERTAYILEFKWDSTKGKKTLEYLVETAKKQVEEKKYIEGVKAVFEGNIKVICVGFKGKEVELELS